MNETALQKIEPMPPVAVNPTVEAMITLAVERGASVDTIERLMAVRREVRQEQAKEAFDRALAEFQDECPVIPKNKVVKNRDNSVRYRYADLEQIKASIGPLLRKHGFSYRFTTKTSENRMITTCLVTHIAGHTEPSEFEVPIEKSGRMNAVQESGSSSTYAKRYALSNGLGIITSDEDNDGNTAAKGDNVKGSQGQERLRTSAKPKEPAKPAAATEKTRAWFLGELRKRFDEQPILQWAIDRNPAYLLPNERLDEFPLSRVPTTRHALDEMIQEIAAFMGVQPRPVGESTQNALKSSESNSGRVETASQGSNASHTAKQAPQKAPSASQDGPEAQPWFNAVVPVPYAGMKRDEYLKNPDTIGELYNARHDDEQARRRLFGFLHNFEPKGWTGRDGKPRPPSDSDKKFRDDLDAFGEWFEENHPDEAEND